MSLKIQVCWLTCTVWDAITNEVTENSLSSYPSAFNLSLLGHWSAEPSFHVCGLLIFPLLGNSKIFFYLFVWNCSESSVGKMVLVWPRKCSVLQWFLVQNYLQNVLKSMYWPWESSFFTCLWIKGDIVTLMVLALQWKEQAVCIILSFFLGYCGCSSCSVFQLLSKTGKNKNFLAAEENSNNNFIIYPAVPHRFCWILNWGSFIPFRSKKSPLILNK